ncbi:hypothetical protein PsYK624_099380 [Phanerochaete sordida]|uniref:Uncharacterized protein n=1 Tax=Phanerochaete sordida TaxID=48140 RepID=A0A9P3LH59_9APHY|nr:hypothetical protein PsYK624_099380 [Phanerochaete sordida]
MQPQPPPQQTMFNQLWYKSPVLSDGTHTIVVTVQSRERCAANDILGLININMVIVLNRAAVFAVVIAAVVAVTATNIVANISASLVADITTDIATYLAADLSTDLAADPPGDHDAPSGSAPQINPSSGAGSSRHTECTWNASSCAEAKPR